MSPAYLRAATVLPEPDYKRGCSGKVAHVTERLARKVRYKTNAKDVYQCRFCGLWHVTKRGKIGKW